MSPATKLFGTRRQKITFSVCLLNREYGNRIIIFWFRFLQHLEGKKIKQRRNPVHNGCRLFNRQITISHINSVTFIYVNSHDSYTSASPRFLSPLLEPNSPTASIKSPEDDWRLLTRTACWFRTMYGRIARLARLRRDGLPREVNLSRTTIKQMLARITRT